MRFGRQLKRSNRTGAFVFGSNARPSPACHLNVIQLSRDHQHVIAQNDFVMEYATIGFVFCLTARVTQ
jgi:hypothetical protein